METAIINIGRNNFIKRPEGVYQIETFKRIKIHRSRYEQDHNNFRIFAEKQWYKKDSEMLLCSVESIQLVLDEPVGYGFGLYFETSSTTRQSASAYKKSPIPKNLKYREHIYEINMCFKQGINLTFDDLHLSRSRARIFIDAFLIKNEIVCAVDMF